MNELNNFFNRKNITELSEESKDKMLNVLSDFVNLTSKLTLSEIFFLSRTLTTMLLEMGCHNDNFIETLTIGEYNTIFRHFHNSITTLLEYGKRCSGRDRDIVIRSLIIRFSNASYENLTAIPTICNIDILTEEEQKEEDEFWNSVNRELELFKENGLSDEEIDDIQNMQMQNLLNNAEKPLQELIDEYKASKQ